MVQTAIQNTCNCYYHFEKLRDPSHNWAYPTARLETYFADAGLKIEHTEELSKEIEFEPWANRMGVKEEMKANLRDMLNNALEPVRVFLTPRADGAKIFFALHEAIIIGRKA